jgi:hypothetical protein
LSNRHLKILYTFVKFKLLVTLETNPTSVKAANRMVKFPLRFNTSKNELRSGGISRTLSIT